MLSRTKSAERMRSEQEVEGHELTCDLNEIVGVNIQHDGSGRDALAQFKQRVERQGGHVGLRPALSRLLDVFLKFDPSAN